MTKSDVFPTQEVGYCQLGEMQLWVSNLGRESDPTFGQARDISVSAMASFGGLLAANNYKISRVEVAGRTITNLTPVFDLDATDSSAPTQTARAAAWRTSTATATFDDLAILDSFPIKIFYEFDCAAASVTTWTRTARMMRRPPFRSSRTSRRLWEYDRGLVSHPYTRHATFRTTSSSARSRTPSALGAPFQVELEFGRLVFRFREQL